MIHPKFIPTITKQIYRHWLRSILTIGGVACSMFLFCAVQAMQKGVAEATQSTAKDTTLVVYRMDRYCPMASNLPERYKDQIRKIPGVTEVIPVRVVPTNCRASLEVITFRGVPAAQFAENGLDKFKIVSGSIEDWTRRSDSSLISQDIATRKGLKVGDRFEAAGVTSYVAAIFEGHGVQDHSIAFVDLPFLQQNSGLRKLGIVTQFNVKVDDPKNLQKVSEAIDDMFRKDTEPTVTTPEKEFVARAASGAIQIIKFTRYLGFGCLAAVIALVGNAIVLSVQDRIRDHAILQTLGYNRWLIARMIVIEGALLGLSGGVIGITLLIGVLKLLEVAGLISGMAISSEGVTISMQIGAVVLAKGVLMSVLLGAVASLVPAFQASRREIATCFRAV